MALWLARSGKYGELEERFLADGALYVGWEGIFSTDLSAAKSGEDVRRALEAAYPAETRGRIANWGGQISVFVLHMRPGDLVVMPLKKKPAIALGEIVDGYRYEAKAEPAFRHVRRVKWLKTLPRSAFDRDLLYSFGAFMTLCKIERNDAEARVRAMLKGEAPRLGAAAQPQADGAKEDAATVNLEELARDQLAEAIIRRFKGDRMELLVEAILKAQGFTTYRSPVGADKGVDLLAAPGTLGFGSPRICVQVKSGDAPVDRPTLDQLVGTMKRVNADHGLLVSWGGFKDSVERERANQFFSVRFWNQFDVIEQLSQVYDSLDEGMKAELPLKRIWLVADAEGDED